MSRAPRKAASVPRQTSFEDELQFESATEAKPVSIETVRAEAAVCRACPLWEKATQTVFGEGPIPADLMFVGEQPGDSEDLQGRPFVGPAGKLLDAALAEAELDRLRIYITNAVKHFKWEPMGNRRLHKKPGAREIEACRPWLLSEIALVKPRVLACLGGTAAQSVLQRPFRVLENRGRLFATELAQQTVVTVHPSSILRARDEMSREREYQAFVADLKSIKATLD